MINVLINLIIILILVFTIYNYKPTEHMVNISKPINKITWSTDKSCGYQMTKVYLDILKEYDIKQNNNDWVLYFPCTYDESEEEIKKINASNKNQRIFMITNTNDIASKSDLWKNLVKKYGRKEAITMAPISYVLYDPDDINLFQKEYDRTKLYIMKKNIQRQEGLKITNNKDEILKGYNNSYVIVQELLMDPYLIRGRKTNMRFYLLLVCQNGEISAYVHNDGFMYYTKVPFKKDSNETAPNITTGYIERWIYKVNPLTHQDFRNYLDDHNRELTLAEKEVINNNQKLSKLIFDRINELLVKIVKSVDYKLCKGNILKNNLTFQLFGVDIAVDDKLNPKVMEVNIGPNLNTHDGRDSEIKHKVVRDIFRILKIIPDDKSNGFIHLL
ncbi:tubulin-tyrosine ligase family protein [Indivirus ILV1]|uniref:Tubulin-tyrosine ligase family protein n=1 Tax=Indivirus ILV1 TaxID=1977633 RepID=A0A1V0SDK1_9VIRU|nr:tubulin-tyrosine ligase family protein [Indivirus ILV1]